MASQDTGAGRGHGHPSQGSEELPGPDAMLGVWTSWMEAMAGPEGRG